MSATFCNCERCGAWETKDVDSTEGECRRRSPLVLDSAWKGVWPIVKNTDGCCDAVPQRTGDDF